MDNAQTDTKKSNILIFILMGLVVAATALGVAFYQSSQESAEDEAAAVEVVSAEHEGEHAAPAAKQNQAQKKVVTQKNESGSLLDKIKSVDIEVHGAKNPCTETQRMMKQCSD